ncbi:MAG: SIS domain-containing protein [Acidimicrobiales bacterium]
MADPSVADPSVADPSVGELSAPGALPLCVRRHLRDARAALDALEEVTPTLVAWTEVLVDRLSGGGRLLVAGNGGSAALAQHLSAELVGRFRAERPPFAALALCADSAALTALGNDYGYDAVFARQVAAHGRPGDVFLAISTSGASPNLLRAAAAAADAGLTAWALTGPAPNPLALRCAEAVRAGEPVAAAALRAATTAAVQEAQQVAVHLMCLLFDAAMVAA